MMYFTLFKLALLVEGDILEVQGKEKEMKKAIITATIISTVVLAASVIVCTPTLNIMEFDAEQMAYGIFAMAAAALAAREYVAWNTRKEKK